MATPGTSAGSVPSAIRRVAILSLLGGMLLGPALRPTLAADLGASPPERSSPVQVLSVGSPVQDVWRLGEHFLAVNAARKMQLWDLRDADVAQKELPLPLGPGLGAPITVPAVPLGLRGVVLAQTRGSEPHPLARRVQVLDWDGKEVWAYTAPPEWRVQGLAASRDGAVLAWSESADDLDSTQFRIHVLETGTWTVSVDGTFQLLESPERVSALAFSPDLRFLAFGATSGCQTVGVLDIASKEVLWHRQPPNTGGAYDLAWSADGRSIFGVNLNGVLNLYERDTGAIVWSRTVEGPWPYEPGRGRMTRDRLRNVAVSPDGKLVAATAEFSRRVVLWDAATGDRLAEYRFSDAPTRTLAFRPDGRSIWAAAYRKGGLRAYATDVVERQGYGEGGDGLTVEAARAALVALMESGPPGGDGMSYTLDAVRTAAPREAPEGYISIGPWRCDLEKRTFVLSIVNPPIFYEASGEFRRTEDGGWLAVVTGITRN